MVNDGTYLKSDGNTSLGADDGIGLAIALNIADGKMKHGPLRIIVTTDEEHGLTGATNLDSKYYTDINYLINIDSETEGEITVSTAFSDAAKFTKQYSAAARTKDTSCKIAISGLQSGHSGLDIDKGRLNGGIAIGKVLNKLEKVFCDSYKELYNEGIEVVAVHAGLECGAFASANKDLNMVAVGPTITDPHSVNEMVEIASIQKVWELLEHVLANIS